MSAPSTPSRPVLEVGRARRSRVQREMLRRALVPEVDESLYLRSASFHATVDELVELLPRWLEGIAAEARAELEGIAAAVRAGVQGLPHEPPPAPTVGPALLARLALHEVTT